MNIRHQYIRACAATVRADFASATGTIAPALLPLDAVAEQLFQISAFDDPTLAEGINGELNPQIGAIRLRPGLRETRRRFVLAHELGHVVLEGGMLQLFEDDDATIDELVGAADEREAGVLRAYNTRERAEREANLFALELLVPADTLWHAVQQVGWTVEALARQFGVSPDALRTQLVNVCCFPQPQALPTSPVGSTTGNHVPPDQHQQAAIDATLPVLVAAGPGTGKTRTIVSKYLSLLENGVKPTNILALTFSNKAAEELRERIIAATQGSEAPSPSLAEIEVSTFHAWGLNFLRQFGHHLDLPADARLRSAADLYVLLRRRLADLPLEQYKDLREPGMYLRQIIGAISRAKDELVEPAAYAALAEREGARLVAEAETEHGGKTTKTARQAIERAQRDGARLREIAAVYARYGQILREESALDYGDLISFAVAALRIPEVAEAAHRQYQFILVDEFQDINYASGELLKLLDGGRGRLWAVGDPWQSIYRFRGASPANVAEFARAYPGAAACDLARNYRSFQAILDASHAVMTPDPLFAVRAGLTAARSLPHDCPVSEWVVATPEAEHAAIAHDILRCTRLRRLPIAVHRREHAGLRRYAGRAAIASHRRAAVPKQRRQLADHAILCRTNAQAEQIAAVLRAYRIPVDLTGDLFDSSDVQDALALLGVGAGDAASLLRVGTIPGYASDESVIHALFQARPAGESSLLATHAPQLAVFQLIRDLAGYDDAWRALVAYVFEQSEQVRGQIIAAANGDLAARRVLAALGQLVTLAKSFVRQAGEGQRGPGAFVGYVRTLIEGGERMLLNLADDGADMVRVMTVHAAKGLEFPVVYLPGLREGVYPPRRQARSIPALPGLAHGADDEGGEERYLLYVAMTRARDQLILIRPNLLREKLAKRSPLLPGGEDAASAPWPVVRRRVPEPYPTLESASRLHSAPFVGEPLTATGLETYERCPRQFFYRYGYRLEGNLPAYPRALSAHRTIAATLTQLAEAGALPNDATELSVVVANAFTEHNLDQVLYRDDYIAEAQAFAALTLDDLRSATPPTNHVRQTVRLPSGDVRVSIDRVEQSEQGPRFVRVRARRQRDGDHLTTRMTLYALAQEQAGGGEVALAYPASGERRSVSHKPAALHERGQTLDTLLQRINAGDYAPAPGTQCATCPFVLICPV